MKKMLLIIPITFLALLLLIGFGNQNCLAATVPSILLIDGDDSGTDVVFDITYDGPGDLDYRISSGAWTDVPWSSSTAQLSPEGGDTLDFRLTYLSKDYYSYYDTDATVTYTGSIINSSFARNPEWWDDQYYGTVWLDWDIAANIKLEILNTPNVHDGFAPVPIPTSVLLLGAGLLGLIGIGFRRRKSRIT